MKERALRLIRQARGKALAYAVYAAVMAAAIAGLALLGEREYHVRLERLQHELGDVSGAVTTLVGTSVDHVDGLRAQAEALLADSASSFSARRLYAGLQPSDGFAGYALDHLPVGELEDQVANLTGSGEIPPIVSGAGKEMLMALALNPLLKAARRQVPEAAWIYYTSANRFMVLQPWVPSRDFHWSEDLLTYDFYKMGLPKENPQRVAFWTDVYLDAAGKGLMATTARPIYDKYDRFRGTIALDLTLGTMNRWLDRGDFRDARVLLVNNKNHVIADSATQGAPIAALTDLAPALPKSTALATAVLATYETGGFQQVDGWLLETTPVREAPWRLILLVDRATLLFEVMRSIWIGFVGLAVLAVAVVAVEQRRRAAGALAENVGALQRMTLTLAAARDEAQQANSAKSMLLANVSHELRTPLNAIIGFSDLMRHHLYGPLGNARYDDYLNDIQKSGQLLLALINDLLDVTKLEAGRYELSESDCDLVAIVEEAVALVRVQAERGGVALQIKINGPLPSIYADERALRQILLNLLSNAIKFTASGGSVLVSALRDAAGNPTIAVKDTGRGIPHDEIKDLFQPFARTTETKRASTPGTGLGLAIVKSLVELHQGGIALESRVGTGTTVTVTLPAQRILAEDTRGVA